MLILQCTNSNKRIVSSLSFSFRWDAKVFKQKGVWKDELMTKLSSVEHFVRFSDEWRGVAAQKGYYRTGETQLHKLSVPFQDDLHWKRIAFSKTHIGYFWRQ